MNTIYVSPEITVNNELFCDGVKNRYLKSLVTFETSRDQEHRQETLIKVERNTKIQKKHLGHATDLIGKLMLNNFVIYMIMEWKKMKSRISSWQKCFLSTVLLASHMVVLKRFRTLYPSNKSSYLAQFTISPVIFSSLLTIFMTDTQKIKSLLTKLTLHCMYASLQVFGGIFAAAAANDEERLPDKRSDPVVWQYLRTLWGRLVLLCHANTFFNETFFFRGKDWWLYSVWVFFVLFHLTFR